MVEIQAKAFSSCTALTSVTIPSSVTLIRGGAFEYCTGLTDVTMKRTGPTTLEGDSYIFQDVDLSNVKLHIPAGSEVYYLSTLWNSFGTKVVYGTCGDNLTWEFNPSTGTLTIMGDGAMYDYTNSSSSPLAPWYSYRNDITSVSLPDGLTRIGNYAFLSAQITSFTIPSSITSIGNSVFHSCPMTDVYVSWTDPTAITLANGAFNSNTSISNVNLHVPAGTYATYAAADGWKKFNIVDPIGGKCGDNLVWSYNSSTTTLTFNGTGVMSSYTITNPAPWTDYTAAITSIVLPEGLTIIGGQAFQGCTSLPSIDIPSSVTMIYGNAFNGCTNLETVTFAGSNLTLIGGSAFKNCTGLTSITLPNSVATISAYAFSGCTGLTSVTLSEDLTTIANYAFQGCSNLHDVTVHWTDLSGITTEASAFNGLTTSNINLHVPAGTYATYAAVAPWNSFNIIDPYGGKCGDNLIWIYDPSNTTLTITGTGDMYDYTLNIDVPWFAYQTAIESVSLPVGLTNIGVRAFMGCTALTSVTIPAGVTSIKERAFQGCSGLTSITIPAGVTSIGARSFHNCSKMENITFADGSALQTIGNMAFAVTGLTFINIPAGVISIGNTTFSSCPSLTSITIPASVNSIDMLAFAYCTGLKDVYVNWTDLSGVTTGEYAFSGVTLANVNLHLPFAAWESYEATAPWSGFKQVPMITAKADPEHAGVYYNTFYHSSVAYALPANVEAYTAKRSGSDLILTKVAQAGQTLPANTAVILKSSVASYEMTPSDATPVTVGENDLQGVDAATAAPSNCYVLSGPNSTNGLTEVGFYTFSGTLGAHKAYMVVSGGADAPKRLRFVFDAATGVESLQPSDVSIQKVMRDGVILIERDGRLYDLNGRMVK